MAIRSVHLIASLGLALSLAACASSKDAGTTAPGGKSQAEINAERDKAAAKAREQGLVDLANSDLEKGRWVSAMKRADEALSANPDNADAYAIKGAALWRAGDFDGSTAALEKAVELDPKNFGAALALSRNLQAAGDHARSLEVQDALIASEGEGFTATACNEDGSCDAGVCNAETKQCMAPMEALPRASKLWSQYLMLDIEGANGTLDDLFLAVGLDEGTTLIAQSYAAFVRPLVGKGPFVTVEGDAGSSDLQIETTQGLKLTSLVVGGEFSRTILQEIQEETRISSELAEALELKELAKVKPANLDQELGLVLIPEIAVGPKGEMKIKNVPALVQDLSFYEGAVGEVPGLVLGRQVLHRLGGVTYDFPAASVTFTKDEAKAPEGSVEQRLLMIDVKSMLLHVPATQVSIEESEHKFWAWLGGLYGAGLAMTSKAYLKSGHRPADIDPPDDPNAGLKMVMVEAVKVGDAKLPGVGGLVLTNTPPDAGLENVRSGASFELGGYLNYALLSNWTVTVSYRDGKIWFKPAA